MGQVDEGRVGKGQSAMGPSERDLLEQLVRQVGQVRSGLSDLQRDVSDLRATMNHEFHAVRVEMEHMGDRLRGEMHGIRDELRGDIRAVHAELRDMRGDLVIFTGHFDTQRRAISEDVDRKLYALRHELKEEIAVASERFDRRVQVLEEEATLRRKSEGGR